MPRPGAAARRPSARPPHLGAAWLNLACGWVCPVPGRPLGAPLPGHVLWALCGWSSSSGWCAGSRRVRSGNMVGRWVRGGVSGPGASVGRPLATPRTLGDTWLNLACRWVCRIPGLLPGAPQPGHVLWVQPRWSSGAVCCAGSRGSRWAPFNEATSHGRCLVGPRVWVGVPRSEVSSGRPSATPHLFGCCLVGPRVPVGVVVRGLACLVCCSMCRFPSLRHLVTVVAWDPVSCSDCRRQRASSACRVAAQYFDSTQTSVLQQIAHCIGTFASSCFRKMWPCDNIWRSQV